MKDSLEELARITEIILKEELNHSELIKATADLKALFLTATDMNLEGATTSEDLHLNYGKAIGPVGAARCIDDYIRTKRFICGIYEAIKDRSLSKNNAPVQIVYSGTGPFATLLMPLITQFSPKEMQWILLEVNPDTINFLKQTIATFDAEAYVKEIHLYDATKFKFKPNSEVDIIVVECLMSSLAKEPQVAITYNLISQSPEDVILIPQEIKLNLAFFRATLNGEVAYSYKPISTLFCLNKTGVRKHLKNLKNNKITFEEKITVIPNSFEVGCSISICTELITYKNHKILVNESGLTVAEMIYTTSKGNVPKKVSSQYVLGEVPELKIKFDVEGK